MTRNEVQKVRGKGANRCPAIPSSIRRVATPACDSYGRSGPLSCWKLELGRRAKGFMHMNGVSSARGPDLSEYESIASVVALEQCARRVAMAVPGLLLGFENLC